MTFPISQLDNVPCVKGIYYLYNEGATVYIGRTNGVRRRLKEHASTKNIDAFDFHALKDYEDDKTYEKRALHGYIARFGSLPPYNKKLG